MGRLVTIQKRAKLNEVLTISEKGNGGAHHKYLIEDINCGKPMGVIQFQDGRRSGTERDGVLDVDLLEIVRHRLQCFQEGEFSCRENACALTHVEEALMWLNRRVEDRLERKVLGDNCK